jgi:hypothetical protein
MVLFDSPVSPKKFITKWPASYFSERRVYYDCVNFSELFSTDDGKTINN